MSVLVQVQMSSFP